MFENPRRGRQAKNFTTNVPKILDPKSSSEQIFSENWRWVLLVVHTHRGHRAKCPAERLGLVLLKSNPDTWIFTSFVVGPVLWCGTDSIRYVTLHFRDQRYTASLRYRNRAEITVLVCERKPYPVLFSCRFKSCLGEWEKSLSWLFPVSYWIDHYLGYQRFFSRAAGIFGVGRSHERRSREKKRETALEKSLAPRVIDHWPRRGIS